jgi:hypothetical protein
MLDTHAQIVEAFIMETNAKSIRRWAKLGLAAQILFILSWLVAGFWQGAGYSVRKHSISDMYAVNAPSGTFLVVCLTIAGALTILFVARSLWPLLHTAGKRAVAALLLLGLSIYGLGDLLSPFEREACRLADPGCTPSAQTASIGGLLDGILSLFGLIFFITALFLLAAVFKHLPEWRPWHKHIKWLAIIYTALFVLTAISPALHIHGVAERLLASAGAVIIGLLAIIAMRIGEPHK